MKQMFLNLYFVGRKISFMIASHNAEGIL